MRKSIKKINKRKTTKKQAIKRKTTKKYRGKKIIGGRVNYSPEDMTSFKNWIADLSESSQSDIEQKNWLLNNIERMPYEENYEFNWHAVIDDPSEKPYYQGIDRMNGYLHGFGGW